MSAATTACGVSRTILRQVVSGALWLATVRGMGTVMGTTKPGSAMSGQRSGPQFEPAPLITGAILLGAGALIGLVGLAIGGGHLVAATRRWIDELETPPSELARQKWVQGKAAVQAGTAAWQNGSPVNAGAASAR